MKSSSSKYELKIKVIRGLWGNFNSYKNEIPKVPLYDEMVYVWGVDNFNHLKKLGYDVTLMGENIQTPHQSFNLKLECLIRGESDFKEVIFMDWDVKQVKEIDEIFHSDLRQKSFSMPTYSYPIEYLELKGDEWVKEIINEFKKYGWRLGDSIVIPNAGFIYSNNSNIPYELNKITKDRHVKTLVEEFTMWIYSNCDLETYIKQYEPKCIFGRPDRPFKLNHIETNTERNLHQLINTLVEKNIYFIHD